MAGTVLVWVAVSYNHKTDLHMYGLANKIAGSLSHRAAMGRVREENLRETHRYPHSSAAGATIMSGVAGNSLRNVFNSMRSRVKGCIDCNGGHTKY